jgi:hypothetical protein
MRRHGDGTRTYPALLDRARAADGILVGVLAAVSYIPLFLTKPGQIAADTKAYLYLDPGKLTTGAASMWDPNTGMGTVTHQNIGYLFPMGPYYTVVHWLGIPMWAGQRFWMGSLMFFAGLGAAYCARQLGLEGIGRAVTAIAYTLTPYVLVYLDRISAILMPWSALGWLVGLTIMGARTGRWRYPAAFAVVVGLVGGVNATSIVLVLLAPGIWLVHAAWISREITWRRAWSTALRLGSLSLLVSLWWAAGLWAEGRYGINVLRVTETVKTVSITSSAAEVLRGLGYWYFYGWDKVQPWTLPAASYTQSLWLVALSLTLPAFSIAIGLLARWVYRSFALALVGVGTVVAVGAYPYSHPSLIGAAIKGGSAGSTVTLAMRSVDRVVPIVVLGLALMLGSGIAAVQLRWPRVGLVAAATAVALTALNLPALWTGGIIASNLAGPSSVPSYWTSAIDYLNSQGSASRVLGLPGEDFAAYSWGVTQDPVGPGLLDRPYVGRQATPAGTPASANLLQAVDQPLQEGILDMSALAPMARLMSVGQILLQSDLQYERYHLPLPQYLWGEMVPAPEGLSAPTTFGGPNPAPTIRYPLNSELRLGLPAGDPQPPALAVFDVSDPRYLVRTESSGQPLIVAGDGSGLVEAAGSGILSGGGSQPILYAAPLVQNPAQFEQAMAAGAELVITDTNPLADYRWGSLRDNVGQVEQPGAGNLVSNPSDYALPVFPGETTADQTIAEVSGIESVRASSYGDPLNFTPENRPINAVDGSYGTAWSFGAHESPDGGRIQINLTQSVTTDHVSLTQVQLVNPNRRITSVTLLFDGGHPVTVDLNNASWSVPGQTVTFPSRTFNQLQVVVDSATGGADKKYDGLAPVGFAEIAIPGVGAASETLRMPTDLLTEAGVNSIDHPLAVLMQRSRSIEPPRHDPDPEMSRTFELPTARSFSISGTAEVNSDDSDSLIDQLIGLPSTTAPSAGGATVIAADSSTRLDSDRQARAMDAVDGNADTAWIAETGPLPRSGEWLSFILNQPITFDHLALQVVNDGRHSLPTRITIKTDSGSENVDVPEPAVGVGRQQGATSSIPLTLKKPLTGRHIKVTIDAIQPVRSLDYYSTFAGLTDVLPVGIAELGLPGVDAPAEPYAVPSHCQSGLLKIDGQPVDVMVAGTVSAALSGDQLALEPCGNSVNGIRLGPGPHNVQTSPRLPSGWSIDQLWMESAAGGPALAGSWADAQPTLTGPPVVQPQDQNRTTATVKVDGNGQAFWLVLGQSLSSGWSATLPNGRSLGAPQLIDGYANGWYVPAGVVKGPTVIHLEWKPQRLVWAAIGVSGVALVGSLLVAVWPERWNPWRRRRPARMGERRPPLAPATFGTLAAVDLPRLRAGPSLKRVAVAAVVWGAVGAVASVPWIGLAGAVAVVIGCVWSRGRLVVRVAAVVALAALPVYAVAQQAAHRYWPDINWPSDLSLANDLAWLGLVWLGADLIAGYVRSRSGARRAPEGIVRR